MRDLTTLADQVVALARAQLGVREDTGQNDGPPSELYMGRRREPWCGHFIAWLYRASNAPIPGDIIPTRVRANPLASVSTMFGVFEREGWLVSTPMRGDIIFLRGRGKSDTGPGNHVGLVERTTMTALECISGNWAHCVTRHLIRRPGLEVTLMGFGRRPQPADWQPPRGPH